MCFLFKNALYHKSGAILAQKKMLLMIMLWQKQLAMVEGKGQKLLRLLHR